MGANLNLYIRNDEWREKSLRFSCAPLMMSTCADPNADKLIYTRKCVITINVVLYLLHGFQLIEFLIKNIQNIEFSL